MADDFDSPEKNAGGCSFELSIPSFSLGDIITALNLPPIPAIPVPPIPIPLPSFELSCDLSKPISVTDGVEPGGGRKATYDADPDDEDT